MSRPVASPPVSSYNNYLHPPRPGKFSPMSPLLCLQPACGADPLLKPLLKLPV